MKTCQTFFTRELKRSATIKTKLLIYIWTNQLVILLTAIVVWEGLKISPIMPWWEGSSWSVSEGLCRVTLSPIIEAILRVHFALTTLSSSENHIKIGNLIVRWSTWCDASTVVLMVKSALVGYFVVQQVAYSSFIATNECSCPNTRGTKNLAPGMRNTWPLIGFGLGVWRKKYSVML